MYIRKSEKVEAVQWTGNIESIEKLDWLKDEIEKQNILFGCNGKEDSNTVCFIDINNEIYKVKDNDYIVKRKDKLYIINKEDFEKHYEIVKSTNKNCIEVKLELDTTEAERKAEEIKNSLDYIKNTEYNSCIMRVITKDEFIIEHTMRRRSKDGAIQLWNKLSKGYNFMLAKDGNINNIYSIEYIHDLLEK